MHMYMYIYIYIKWFPPLGSYKPHIYDNYDKAPDIVSSYPQSSLGNLFARLFTRSPRVKLTPHLSLDKSRRTFQESDP